MITQTGITINAGALSHRQLNASVRKALEEGASDILLRNVRGQRYIGAGLRSACEIIVEGVPGNDLGCFMDGPRMVVRGNAQDAVANTMNSGSVVIHGHAGDVLAYGMRGGRLFVRGNAGYRVGIHMKEYKDRIPVVIVGGTAKDYFGEYMAGGTLVLLGLGRPNGAPLIGEFIGTGMHGGQILLRGPVEAWRLGKEVGRVELNDACWFELERNLADFAREFDIPANAFQRGEFIRLIPVSHRPYGTIYVY
jgi:glutamate synthase domain-containing protein 3